MLREKVCQWRRSRQHYCNHGRRQLFCEDAYLLLVVMVMLNAFLTIISMSSVAGEFVPPFTLSRSRSRIIAKREQNDAKVTTTMLSHTTIGSTGMNLSLNSSLSTTTSLLNSTITTGSRGVPPPRVKLHKCCHFGEYLDISQACVAGSTEQWVPLIFLINRKTYYLPKGSSPKFMIIDENIRPIANNNNSDSSDNDDECSLNELELFTGSSNLILFSNGSLFVSERNQLIEPKRYCIDHEAALVCFPKNKRATYLAAKVKLKKCCGGQFNYNVTTKSCAYVKNSDGKLHLPLLDQNSYETIYGFPKCAKSTTAMATSYIMAGDWQHSTLHLQRDGSDGVLQLHQRNFSLSDFCLEHLIDDDVSSSQDQRTVKVFACLHQRIDSDGLENGLSAVADDVTDKLEVAALNIGIVVSVVFLAATLIAGYLMPSVHHVLHWRCQIYYVACLFIGDLLLAYTQLSNSIELGSWFCLTLASGMHFFFLSAFFWLNTMCFNIWWTFRDFRPSSLERNQELLRLRLFSAYAWGIPLLITTVAACVDQLEETTLWRPGFGVRSCWFSGEHWSIFAYFFCPVGILLIGNIILFILTTRQLTCGLWKRDDVKSPTEKTALVQICLKLVIVMGVTWIADLISWLIGGPHSVWFFTDLINALQGVFIFIVVGCQPQVWSACKRICCPRSRQEITNTTNGVQHSSSSQGMPSMAGCGGAATIGGESSTHNTSISAIGGDNVPISTCTNTLVNSRFSKQDAHSKIPMETVC